MGYESRLRFGFAGSPKVLTRFITDAISTDPEFEDALADLILVKRVGYHLLLNEFDYFKGFCSPDHKSDKWTTHVYARLYGFATEKWQQYVEEGLDGDDELHGAYLRIGEEPDHVEAYWFGENSYLHYSVGGVCTKFYSDDPNLKLEDGLAVRKGRPLHGSYVGYPYDGVMPKQHLDGSVAALLAVLNDEPFPKTDGEAAKRTQTASLDLLLRAAALTRKQPASRN